MLALQFIREHPDEVRAAAANKGVADAPVERILELDGRLRTLIQQTETRAAEQNRLSKAAGPMIGRAKAEGRSVDDVPELGQLEALKAELRTFEQERAEVQRELDGLLLEVSPDDLGIVQEGIGALAPGLGDLGRVEVVGDRRIPRGGCVLRTSEGEVDATHAAQLERARELLVDALR